jgi:hypothetical protein
MYRNICVREPPKQFTLHSRAREFEPPKGLHRSDEIGKLVRHWPRLWAFWDCNIPRGVEFLGDTLLRREFLCKYYLPSQLLSYHGTHGSVTLSTKATPNLLES